MRRTFFKARTLESYQLNYSETPIKFELTQHQEPEKPVTLYFAGMKNELAPKIQHTLSFVRKDSMPLQYRFVLDQSTDVWGLGIISIDQEYTSYEDV
jgi:hypothetical protein